MEATSKPPRTCQTSMNINLRIFAVAVTLQVFMLSKASFLAARAIFKFREVLACYCNWYPQLIYLWLDNYNAFSLGERLKRSMGKGSVTTNKRLADCRKKDQFESQQSITVFAVIAITRR